MTFIEIFYAFFRSAGGTNVLKNVVSISALPVLKKTRQHDPTMWYPRRSATSMSLKSSPKNFKYAIKHNEIGIEMQEKRAPLTWHSRFADWPPGSLTMCSWSFDVKEGKNSFPTMWKWKVNCFLLSPCFINAQCHFRVFLPYFNNTLIFLPRKRFMGLFLCSDEFNFFTNDRFTSSSLQLFQTRLKINEKVTPLESSFRSFLTP